GGGHTRIFEVSGSTTHAVIDDLTIADGRLQDDISFGAGLLNTGAVVSLARVVFTSNQTNGSLVSQGGAIASLLGANLTVCGCTFRGNVATTLSLDFQAAGGAILCDAGSTAVIQDSAFIGNQAKGSGTGGALCEFDGSQMTVSRCTFDNNLVQDDRVVTGGGI